MFRGQFDDQPEVVAFAEKLEQACVATVEGGEMTKDLAICIHGTAATRDTYLNTEEFFEALVRKLNA